MVLLHEEDINYPPTNTLPKATGPWVLCKLVQYPMKDRDGNIVADEYRQPVFSSLFANAVMFMGKITTRTTWVTGQQNQSGTAQKVYSLSLSGYSDEDILEWIDEGNVFVYMNRDDEDEPPKSIKAYEELISDTKKEEVKEIKKEVPTPDMKDTQQQHADVTPN